MKTLLFTLEYPPFKGGIANYYSNIVKYWLDPKDIFVLHNNNNDLVKDWLWPKWLPALWKLRRAVKQRGIGHILVGHILPLGTVAYFVAKFTKTSYSVILHGMDFTYALRDRRKKSLARRILKKADNIICANTYTAGLVKDFLGEKYKNKIAVINPGVALTPGPSPASRERGAGLASKYNLHNKIVLFSIGRLVKRKGFDKVIKVMPKVLERTPNLVYAIAGAGPDEEYLKTSPPAPLLNRRGETGERLIFLGKISDEEKWAWLDLCDIFIMPSRNDNGDFEGFGIVYLEANLAGKPVIAGDSGGVRDAVEDNVSGILVNPNSTEAITDGILELALNQGLREMLGQQGWRRAVEKFNWEKQVRIMHSITNNS